MMCKSAQRSSSQRLNGIRFACEYKYDGERALVKFPCDCSEAM